MDFRNAGLLLLIGGQMIIRHRRSHASRIPEELHPGHFSIGSSTCQFYAGRATAWVSFSFFGRWRAMSSQHKKVEIHFIRCAARYDLTLPLCLGIIAPPSIPWMNFCARTERYVAAPVVT